MDFFSTGVFEGDKVKHLLVLRQMHAASFKSQLQLVFCGKGGRIVEGWKLRAGFGSSADEARRLIRCLAFVGVTSRLLDGLVLSARS